MRTILVPFCDDDRADAALRTALVIAEKYKSYVEGLHAWRTPQIIAGEGVVFPSESLTRLAEEGQQFAREARERFNRVINDRSIPFRDVSIYVDEVTCGWREGEGIEAEIVGDYGRLFDLIVLGRTEKGTTADWKTTVEAALFESGRPVLIGAETVPETFGKRVVIGWNGATETARSIAVTMPILAGAEEIKVLTVEGGTVMGPTGDQVAAHLRRNGLNAEALTRNPGGRSIGQAMIDYAGEIGADLLVKGAFTNSRLRQMFFGGATRDVIEKANLPVILAH